MSSQNLKFCRILSFVTTFDMFQKLGLQALVSVKIWSPTNYPLSAFFKHVNLPPPTPMNHQLPLQSL